MLDYESHRQLSLLKRPGRSVGSPSAAQANDGTTAEERRFSAA